MVFSDGSRMPMGLNYGKPIIAQKRGDITLKTVEGVELDVMAVTDTTTSARPGEGSIDYTGWLRLYEHPQDGILSDDFGYGKFFDVDLGQVKLGRCKPLQISTEIPALSEVIHKVEFYWLNIILDPKKEIKKEV